MNTKPIEFLPENMIYMHDEYDIYQKMDAWKANLNAIVPTKCYIGSFETSIRPELNIFDSYGILITDQAFKNINPMRYEYFQASFHIEGTEFPDLPPVHILRDFHLTPSKMNSLIAVFNHIHDLGKILEIETIEKILETPTIDILKEKLSHVTVFNSDYLEPKTGKFMPSYNKIKQINESIEDRITYFVADTNDFGTQVNQKCLIELFGNQRTFCSHKIKDEDTSLFITGWEKLLLHLGVEPPTLESEDDQDSELDCKDRLQSMGVKFPEDIL